MTTTATRTRTKHVTPEEFAAAEAALGHAFHLVEKIEWDTKLARGTGTVATLEDLGRLYSFVDGLRRQVDQLTREQSAIESLLSLMDEDRLTGRVVDG